MMSVNACRLAGANLDARNLGGSTALLAAVETGQVEVVEFLLKEGADVAAVNCFNMAVWGSTLLVDVLLSNLLPG